MAYAADASLHHEPQSFITKYVWSQDHKVIAVQYASVAIFVGLIETAGATKFARASTQKYIGMCFDTTTGSNWLGINCDGPFRVVGQAQGIQGMAHAGLDEGATVHEGAIEIEDDEAGHSAPPPG